MNEAAFLPGLLDDLNAQTRPPDEIIVADAGSKDGTVELAQARGARVVPGGMPGPGRNAGARAATGDVFLFLDADVLPHPNFIELALGEFERSDFVVATCPIEAADGDLADKIITEVTNLYLQVVLPISPRAPGFCIFARRQLHETIGGFDESLKMSEDHDYARRAAQHGPIGVLHSARVPVSMRRLEKEGLVSLALKYLWCEMYALAGKPVHTMPFKYEFGAFQTAAPSKAHHLIDIGELRTLLDRFENPIQRLSHAGLERYRRLVEEPIEATLQDFHQLLDLPDLETLDRYLEQRLALIRENNPVHRGWQKLKSLPQESIRLLEPEWLRSRQPDEAPPVAPQTAPPQTGEPPDQDA